MFFLFRWTCYHSTAKLSISNPQVDINQRSCRSQYFLIRKMSVDLLTPAVTAGLSAIIVLLTKSIRCFASLKNNQVDLEMTWDASKPISQSTTPWLKIVHFLNRCTQHSCVCVFVGCCFAGVWPQWPPLCVFVTASRVTAGQLVSCELSWQRISLFVIVKLTHPTWFTWVKATLPTNVLNLWRCNDGDNDGEGCYSADSKTRCLSMA